MNNDEFNKGMFVAICIEIVGVICIIIALIKWVYGFFAYSIFIEKDRIADQVNSDEATIWFWAGWGIVFLAGLLLYAAKPPGWGENQKRKNNSKRSNYRGRSSNRWNGFSDPDDFPNDGYGNSGWQNASEDDMDDNGMS